MSDDRASISVRMPRWVLDKIRDAASANACPVNAEIVRRLTFSFQRSPTPWATEVEPGDVVSEIKSMPIESLKRRLRYLEAELQQLYEAFVSGNSSSKPIILKRMAELESEYAPLIEAVSSSEMDESKP